MTIRPMRVALGQMNATIGDFAGDGAKIEALWKKAEGAKATTPDDAVDALGARNVKGLALPSRYSSEGSLLDRAEFKRQQAAPGLRVPTKAFGSGRRIPIAQVSKA